MNKEIFYDRQFHTWIGRIVNSYDDQVGDCEYFPRKELALMWKSTPVTEYLKNGVYYSIGEQE
jgi:hypothetical protein